MFYFQTGLSFKIGFRIPNPYYRNRLPLDAIWQYSEQLNPFTKILLLQWSL